MKGEWDGKTKADSITILHQNLVWIISEIASWLKNVYPSFFVVKNANNPASN